jgi:hypothetical protein
LEAISKPTPAVQVEHKIQSADGPLELHLQKVRRQACHAGAASTVDAPAARGHRGMPTVAVLTRSQVPKLLGVLTRCWCPRAFVVSFKLETDQAILIDKARAPPVKLLRLQAIGRAHRLPPDRPKVELRLTASLRACVALCPVQASGALARYGVHLVVANLLHNRKDVVTLVEPGVAATAAGVEGQAGTLADGSARAEEIRRPAGDTDIERLLVAAVAARHRAFRDCATRA